MGGYTGFWGEYKSRVKLGRLPCVQRYMLSRGETGEKMYIVPSLYVRVISLDKKGGLDTVGISI